MSPHDDIEREERAIYLTLIAVLAPVVAVALVQHDALDGGTSLCLGGVVLGALGLRTNRTRRARWPAARVVGAGPLLALLVLMRPPVARADQAPAVVTIGAYLEAFYQAHLQNPENRITNLRGFDHRSRTVTLSNVAVAVTGERGPVTARLALQVGSTPSSYYLAEPAVAGTPSVSETSAELWKYVQAATVTGRLPGEIVVEAGLVPSPIGLEVIPVKDNWNHSRSNLFFGLPFYHTGITAARLLGAGWTAKLHVYNGWNSVVDNNGTPSVAASAAYAEATTSAQLLYFGGIERDGAGWRHLVDAYVQHAITRAVSVAGHVDAGIEPTDLGTSAWYAAAAYAKVALGGELYGAVRADYFRERVAEDDGVRAGAMFWPVEWLASATATVAYQPAAGVSLRLEYRHDQAADEAFFGGRVDVDPSTSAFVPDRTTQDTVTVGATAWF